MNAKDEIASGQRFGFGENWNAFLKVLDEGRIAEAQRSLRDFLAVENLEGKSFLDIGSGSGLFSLVARRMGARVHSFNFDANAVGCAQELKRRYVPEDPSRNIKQGSVYDRDYVD